jgi:hypothetical protein
MPSTIIASTSVQDYVFEPCMTDNPIILPMTAVEIKEIHSKSGVFVDGYLTFEDDIKEDVYNFLKIKDWENILNQSEIMDSILSGKKNDIANLINIKSKGYFERVYGVYIALKQTNRYDISMRVAKAIEHRYKELQQGIIKTQIELVDNFKDDDDKDKEIAEKDEQLKQSQQEVAQLKEQIANLTKLVEEQMKLQNAKTADESKSESRPTPKRGRPASNK